MKLQSRRSLVSGLALMANALPFVWMKSIHASPEPTTVAWPRDYGTIVSSEILHLEDVSHDPRIEIVARALTRDAFGHADELVNANQVSHYSNGAVEIKSSEVLIPRWRNRIDDAKTAIEALDSLWDADHDERTGEVLRRR